MKDAASVVGDLGKKIAASGLEYSKWATDHPVEAKAAAVGGTAAGFLTGGALLYKGITGLLNGFGLGGSAVALDGSAAALGGAAASLEAAAAAIGLAGKAGTAADLGKSAVSTAATGAASTVAATGATAAAATGGVGLLGSLGLLGVGAAASVAIPYAIKAAKDAGYLKPLEDFNRKYLDPHDNAETAFNRLRYGKNISPEDIKKWRESVPFSFEGWGAPTLRSGKKFKADGEEAKELKLFDKDARERLSKSARSLPILAQHRLEPSIEKAEHAKNVLALNRALEPSKQASVSSEKAKHVKAEHIKEIVKVAEPPLRPASFSFAPSVPRVEKLAPTFAGRLEPIEKPAPVPVFAKFDATQLSKDYGKVNVDVQSEVAVHGDVKGEATLMQTVRVDASPQLLATVESARQTTRLKSFWRDCAQQDGAHDGRKQCGQIKRAARDRSRRLQNYKHGVLRMKPLHLCAKPTGAPSADMPELLAPAFADLVKARDGVQVLMVLERTPRRLWRPLAHHAQRRRTVPEHVALALTQMMSALTGERPPRKARKKVEPVSCLS